MKSNLNLKVKDARTQNWDIYVKISNEKIETNALTNNLIEQTQ